MFYLYCRRHDELRAWDNKNGNASKLDHEVRSSNLLTTIL